MRKSLERHPLAVLRRIIGLSQEQFAGKVGLSMSTISKIESLRLPLSAENAVLIESETGCSAAWLSAGDVKAPPRAGIIMPDQKEAWEQSEDKPEPPYDLDTYQWVRSQKEAGLSVEEIKPHDHNYAMALNIQAIVLACHKAKRRGNENYARIRLQNLANQFAQDVGQSEATDEGAMEFTFRLMDAVNKSVVYACGRKWSLERKEAMKSQKSGDTKGLKDESPIED